MDLSRLDLPRHENARDDAVDAMEAGASNFSDGSGSALTIRRLLLATEMARSVGLVLDWSEQTAMTESGMAVTEVGGEWCDLEGSIVWL